MAVHISKSFSLKNHAVISFLVQLIYFFASTREQGPYGPPIWWMKVIGTFPRCDDLRGQTWRLFSYQLVHSDSGHMLFNALM